LELSYGYLRKGVALLFKILIGFVSGVFYGIIYATEVPHGFFSKAGAILKMFFE
jgi:hypothetical protein